ncbi:glutathione S-transferase family protein [Sneathiella sp.]|jgi:glutathione S-transferase|uniref:glutathione S-transferase family protein n=1 Tax=Sneathiella sp. TaxID=1964365 RepID=UPI0039E41D92
MKIHEFKGFPNPARVRIALAEKGLLDPVDFVHVDVPSAEHRKDAFLKKNPSGAVPVLELDDGVFISECTAITEYIDQIDKNSILTGTGAEERARIAMYQRKVEAGFLDAVADFFHHATEGLGPDVEGYQNIEWGEHRKNVAIKTLYWMEEQLVGQEFLAGDRFTVADITAQAGFMFAGFSNLEIPEDCPAVKAYAERLANRESVKQAA